MARHSSPPDRATGPARPDSADGDAPNEALDDLESNPGVPFDLVTLKHAARAFPPPVSAQGYRAGDVLAGKYKLLRVLGHGGMSSVWAVQNLVLDAQYALKLIRNDGGDANAAERMLREARSAARIEHPAIIRMFDFGVTDRGDPFLVMELLTAPSIRERLRREGPMNPAEAVRLLLPIAEALSVVHEHGVVHRDLKPDNIVCVSAGAGRFQPRLIDFGIAKQLDDETSRITQTGFVLGSPEYMSPEQALGLADVDQRTDVWSFSVVLYEMIAGVTPFARDGDFASILHAVVEEPPLPLQDRGVHEPELWAILSRGLRKYRDGRFQDMHSLGVALARWLVRHGVEEDVCSQSVRTVWLGTSSSAPPVALEARDVERARAAALDEPYEVPKRGAFRTMIGAGVGLLVTALIAVGGLYVATGSTPFGVSTKAASGRAPEPAPVKAPARTFDSPNVPAPPLDPPTEEAPRVDAPAPSEAPSPAKPTTSSPDIGSHPRNDHSAKAKPIESHGAIAHRDKSGHERSPGARSKREREEKPPPPSLDDSERSGRTVLPEVKPPPDYGRAPDEPSDNPYVDDETKDGSE